ncbi:MAG TPA: hypothetical protein VE754_04145 [Actinomycetota bacterium]|nr:hypothetical protein [Actinomycetota bacterium]
MLLRSLVAAAVGTMFMTLSSETEMHIRGREASTSPGRAVSKLLSFVGVPQIEGRTLRVLSTWTHWSYGTSWGVVWWLLIDVASLALPLTAVLYFVIVWGTAQVHLPLLGVAPPGWRWGATELAIDAFNHVAYVTGTTIGWVLLGRIG